MMQRKTLCKLFAVLTVAMLLALGVSRSAPVVQAQTGTVELVGQIGGTTQAVFVDGNTAYIGVGPRLVILDISNPANPTKLGQSPSLPGIVRDIDVSGSYAYVANDDEGGLQIINISNPANPTLTGNYNIPGSARGVAVSGSYAYVADEYSGLQIINISNSANPILTARYDTPGTAWGMAVSGSYAYVADSSGLQVVDISNPANPSLTASYDTPGVARGVAVSGSYAYVADSWEGLQIINISNPANPTLTASYDTPSYAQGVAVSGSYAYVAASRGLQIINISNPANPTLTASTDTPYAWGVAVSGSYAYVADGDLQIINISNPVAPTLSSSYTSPGEAYGVTVNGSYAYVADGSKGLQVVDISNPTNPTLTGSYDTPDYDDHAIDVTVNSNFAYVGSGPNGLQVINISDPTNPTLTSSYTALGTTYKVAINGNYAYVSDGPSGLLVLDISNPANPTLTGSYNTPSEALDVTVSGNYAYVADYQSGLQIINISNPANPTLAGSYDTPGEAFGIAVSGNFAYVADGGLQIINISDPANPTLSGSYDTGSAGEVIINDGYAYVADSHILVLDISNPANPSLTATSTDTPGDAREVAVSDDYAYVADGYGGLVILEFTPSTPVVQLSPTNLNFGNQKVNNPSTVQIIIIQNSGTGNFNINNISISGDFSQTNDCGSTVVPSGSCTINVIFTPTASGNRTGILTVSSDASSSPDTVSLSGTGVTSAVSLSPTSLTFGNQPLNQSSGPQTVTLQNSGTADLSIRNISISGDFSQTNDCGSTVVPSGSCTINVTFTPTASGNRTGILTVSSDASSSPDTVSLSGTGVTSAVSLSPTSLTFGNQPLNQSSGPQTVTLQNSGTADLSIRNISISGDFSQTNDCGSTVVPSGSCTINVTFTPTASGNRTGILTVSSDANSSPDTVSLSGTGTTQPGNDELNLTISVLEISQAIQKPDNSVPLVAGRPAIVRLFIEVQNSNSAVSGVTAQLHAARNGTELANSPINPFNVGGSFDAPLNPNRSEFADSLNFYLPSDWLTTGDITLWAEVNPNRTVTEGTYGDNRGPDYNFAFTYVPPLEVVLIPIAYQRNGTGPVYRPNLNARNNYSLGMLQRIYPIPSIRYSIHSEYVFKGDMKTEAGWSQLLREISDLRSRERRGRSYDSAGMPKYYGVLPMEATLWGGLGYRPGTASIGLVDQDDVAAHEIGHNVGLRHVDCGGPAGPDPNYPYVNGSIGQIGVDVYQRELMLDTVYKDFMSYCGPEWISDYYYRGIFNVLSGQSQRQTGRQAEESGWLISGRIEPDGSGMLDNTEIISSSYLVAEPGVGAYQLELVDQDGAVQFRYNFDPIEIAVEEDVLMPADFSFVVPTIENLATIQLRHGDNILDTLTAVSTVPGLDVSQSAGDDGDPNSVSISWELIGNSRQTDETTINVRYSADDGQNWQMLAVGRTDTSLDLSKTQLPASDNGLIEVVALNNTQSETKRVEIGAVENKPPQVGIVSTDTIQAYPQEPIILEGIALDLEDGTVAETNMVWSEAALGQLGTGQTLLLSAGLDAGEYEVTFTATDSAGNSAEATVAITVTTPRNDIYLPLLTK